MIYKILLLLIFCLSCGDNNFPKVEVIDNFRILGIISNNSEVAPGGSANVRPFVTDPLGAGRTVNGNYEICLDPGVSFGATPTCEGVTGAVFGSYSINFTADSDFAANGYTGLAATPVVVNVPATILNGRESRQQFNGVAMLVVFRFSVDGRDVSAFRRIVATNRGTLNANPASPTVLLNGGTFAVKPTKGDKLSLQPLNDEESYDYLTVDGSTETRTESYEVAWFLSRGELNKSKVSINETTKLTKSSSTDTTFVSVVMVRDERGGVSFSRVFLP